LSASDANPSFEVPLTLALVIRQAGPQDVRFLRDMLRHAYHWRLNEDPDLPVARYVNNWGRPGDAGIVAWENGPIGAAWYRLFLRSRSVRTGVRISYSI
jgi:hypothetical protein